MYVCADTNVILRRLHRGHPQHHLARKAITQFNSGENRICVVSQIFIELWAVLTRPLTANGFGLAPEQADRLIARVETSVVRLSDSDEVFGEWRKLVKTYGVSGRKAHDARLVAAVAVHGVRHILTFNAEDFRRYPGVIIIDPSAAS